MAPNQRQRQLLYSRKELKKLNGKRFAKLEEGSEIKLLYPSADTALKFLLSARFCSAMWCHITDCDETYNYWEPSHYLLYGTGQQTWEYSPDYALRSYLYLLIHTVPAKLYQYLLAPNSIAVFYFIRCLLSLGCALSEIYFYKNVCKAFGVHVGRLTLVFLMFSSGMYIASAAFLPSSFSMYLSTVAIAAWYACQYELAVFATAISALLGWPFAALLGVPIAVDMLFVKRYWVKFIKWVVISAAVILVPMVWIDSSYYGKTVVAPLNIVLYNVFTSHGPNLYGTEPLNYYIYNGILNFNFVFLGALAAPFLLFLVWVAVPSGAKDRTCLTYFYYLTPLYLWIMVFFLQPHKEERFLFPIYPMICLAGAVAVDAVLKVYFFIRTKLSSGHINRHYLSYTAFLTFFIIVIFGLLGLSRTIAIYNGYYAPMKVLSGLNNFGTEKDIPKDQDINFCVGKEWHRFPSSFFLPTNQWKLRYLKSEFRGQLPQDFLPHENGTSIVPENFNDVNKEEPSRYIDINNCHFVLDLDINQETDLEPNYSQMTEKFVTIKSVKFLNARKSHPNYRAFYIPFVSHKYCKYGSYNLLQNLNVKMSPSLVKHKEISRGH